MLKIEHGDGLSMKTINEFNEFNKNELQNDELINLSNKIEELLDSLQLDHEEIYEKYNDLNNSDFSIKLNINDIYLFNKIEQIINSFDKTFIRVITNEIFIKANNFKPNENNSKHIFNDYYTIFWFIRDSFLKEIYKYSLKLYENTSNNTVSFNKIEFIPRDISNKIKNIEKFP